MLELMKKVNIDLPVAFYSFKITLGIYCSPVFLLNPILPNPKLRIAENEALLSNIIKIKDTSSVNTM